MPCGARYREESITKTVTLGVESPGARGRDASRESWSPRRGRATRGARFATERRARRAPRHSMDPPAGLLVFPSQALDELACRHHALDRPDPLAAAPDVLPGLAGVAAEVHLARVALRQSVGIEAGGADRALQVVAVHAGEQIGVDDVVARALADQLLVGRGGARLVGGDERRADVGEVGAHRPGGEDRSAVRDRARQRDGTIEPIAD